MKFDIIDEIREFETIAKGPGIRDINRLIKFYGRGNWKKMKGIAHISLPSGKVKLTELHWYEAHGIGKKEIKRSRRKKAARLISGVSELTRMRCLYESREIT